VRSSMKNNVFTGREIAFIETHSAYRAVHKPRSTSRAARQE